MPSRIAIDSASSLSGAELGQQVGDVVAHGVDAYDELFGDGRAE